MMKWGKTHIELIQGDITLIEVDAIVNAANASLMGGGGVDGAIHRAGGPEILEACKKIVAKQGRLPTGEAVITPGGKLKASYVIHTVGPVWQGGKKNEDTFLRSCYRESLKLAQTHQLKSIAFPAISTGAYGYPLDLATAIALSETRGFVLQEKSNLTRIIFALFDTVAYKIYQAELFSYKN